jgi:PAS domain S-box-containing protein
MSKEVNGAEEALTSRDQELRLLVEAIPALVWRAGPEGNIEYVNKRVLDYFGAPLSEVIGWGWMDKVHPDDVAFKVRTWLQNLESENPRDVVCRFRGADGRYRWFEIRGEPLRTARDGAALSWCGVLIDINDRRKAEEALRESEYDLRQIIETVPGLIWSTGPDGKPIHVSQRLLNYTGMRFEDFKHHGWEAFVHPDDLPESVKAYDHALQAGTSYQRVMRLRRADREFRWHHVRCEPLRDRQGRIIQWYGLSVDVDEAKRIEERPGSAAQLRATLNVIPAHTWYAAPSGGLTFVNKRTADYLGLPKGHSLRFGIDIGAQWDAHIAFLHPDDQEESRRAWPVNMRTGEASEFSFRVRDAQGRYRWFLSRVEPLRASDGTLLLWVGANLDIEELKRAEQALRESEYKLRQIIEAVPGLIWSTGPDGEATYANQRLLDYTGTRLEDFKNRKWERFLHPDDLAEFVRAVDHAIQTGTSFEAIHRLRRSNGGYRWHHARMEPLCDREGQIIQWYGLSVDIDEGKKAEDLLRSSEAYLAEAQRLSHTGSSAFHDTTVLYWSDETYRIFGFDQCEGLPSRKAALERIHPDDRERVREEARQAVHDERDYNLQYRILLPDGTIKHIDATAHPKFSASGELVEVVSTIIDVTERKRARQEHERLRQLESDLAHMNRVSMMGELAASLAHEITQPIAAARNNARAALNFLDKQPSDLGEVREALGCVVGDTDRAGGIVDRMRDHIRKAPPRKHRFDLNEAINEVIMLARSAIAENGVSVQTRLSEGLAPVEGDRVQLQQVVLNLVLNAAEAMSLVDSGARQLLISTEQRGANGVLVAVRDSGPGIDAERIERVFDAFYTTKPSGVGMGLSICQSIIEAHSGRLWADANELGGAAFQFTLPSSEGSS